MAFGAMGGAGGSWDDEEKKKRERLRNTNSVLGIGGIGQMANEAAARNKASQEIRTPYNSTAESRASNAALLNKIGVDPTNPYVTGRPKPEPIKNINGRGVVDPNRQNVSDKSIADAARSVYSDDNSPISAAQGNKSYGLSITPSPDKASAAQNFAATIQGNTVNQLGFNNPKAPQRSAKADQERAALIRQASTIQAGAKGITAAQMNVLAGLQGNDDKFANDQYQAQLGAASNMAQSQVRETNANARAALGEVSAAERQGQQLGFDAARFQESLGLDNRKLAMAQDNQDTQNFAPKQLNALYEKYELAETDEDKSAIATQIQALKGTASSDKYVAIDGGETLSADGLTAIKNPAVLLNTRDGSTKQQSKAERSFSDPYMVALQARTDISMEEKEKLANNYLDGGEV